MRTICVASDHGLVPVRTVVAPALLCGVQERRETFGTYQATWSVVAFPLMGPEFVVARFGPSRDGYEGRDRALAEGVTADIREIMDEEGNPFA